jgi:hypothetical protein
MKPASYYTGLTDGDIAYFRVRPARPGHVTSERHHWGLRELDADTGELLASSSGTPPSDCRPSCLKPSPSLTAPRVTITADQLTHRA